ncbi:cell division protein ZapA [Variovorax sp. VNK109]|jgi:cell division protein ZapA|uniref:cell division protein ZapA n=1 Tax=Variovorax sp. VNK109 TaxID=3400919 RepID=UPI003C0F66A3
MTAKQLEVQIMGQSYLLGCPEGGEQQLLDAVERVDSAMCRIRDAGRIKARDRIAVLAALNIAADAGDRPAAPAVTIPARPHAEGEEADDPRLAALLARLDSTLQDDGQLL